MVLREHAHSCTYTHTHFVSRIYIYTFRKTTAASRTRLHLKVIPNNVTVPNKHEPSATEGVLACVASPPPPSDPRHDYKYPGNQTIRLLSVKQRRKKETGKEVNACTMNIPGRDGVGFVPAETKHDGAAPPSSLLTKLQELTAPRVPITEQSTLRARMLARSALFCALPAS